MSSTTGDSHIGTETSSEAPSDVAVVETSVLQPKLTIAEMSAILERLIDITIRANNWPFELISEFQQRKPAEYPKDLYCPLGGDYTLSFFTMAIEAIKTNMTLQQWAIIYIKARIPAKDQLLTTNVAEENEAGEVVNNTFFTKRMEQLFEMAYVTADYTVPHGWIYLIASLARYAHLHKLTSPNELAEKYINTFVLGIGKNASEAFAPVIAMFNSSATKKFGPVDPRMVTYTKSNKHNVPAKNTPVLQAFLKVQSTPSSSRQNTPAGNVPTKFLLEPGQREATVIRVNVNQGNWKALRRACPSLPESFQKWLSSIRAPIKDPFFFNNKNFMFELMRPMNVQLLWNIKAAYITSLLAMIPTARLLAANQDEFWIEVPKDLSILSALPKDEVRIELVRYVMLNLSKTSQNLKGDPRMVLISRLFDRDTQSFTPRCRTILSGVASDMYAMVARVAIQHQATSDIDLMAMGGAGTGNEQVIAFVPIDIEPVDLRVFLPSELKEMAAMAAAAATQ